MAHNSYTMSTHGLPDLVAMPSALKPAALGVQVYISGKPLALMPIYVSIIYMYICSYMNMRIYTAKYNTYVYA